MEDETPYVLYVSPSEESHDLEHCITVPISCKISMNKGVQVSVALKNFVCANTNTMSHIRTSTARIGSTDGWNIANERHHCIYFVIADLSDHTHFIYISSQPASPTCKQDSSHPPTKYHSPSHSS